MPDELVVELPSGGTWRLKSRLSWGDVRKLVGEDDANGQLIVASLGWSFEGPVTSESIDARDPYDVMAAQEAFDEVLLPLLQRLLERGRKRLSANSPNGSTTMTSPASTPT
jgi:hypothetical protein